MHPLTDIICLVHNQLPVTKGFVDRLFKYTDNFRLIFVDNASSDGTAEYLAQGEQEKKWAVITSPENLGVIKGRNLGAKSVTADYFLNIDNDQYVTPAWLDLLFELLNKGYDIVGCEAWLLHPPTTGGAVVLNGRNHGRAYYPHRRCQRPTEKFSYIGCGGMLIKRSVYETIGLFDERFSPAYFEDPDFSFRAIQAGFKLGWQPSCKIDHLAHKTLGTQTSFDKNQQFLKSWQAFITKWNPWFPQPIQMGVTR